VSRRTPKHACPHARSTSLYISSQIILPTGQSNLRCHSFSGASLYTEREKGRSFRVNNSIKLALPSVLKFSINRTVIMMGVSRFPPRTLTKITHIQLIVLPRHSSCPLPRRRHVFGCKSLHDTRLPFVAGSDQEDVHDMSYLVRQGVGARRNSGRAQRAFYVFSSDI
jgi:hypothetical protein